MGGILNFNDLSKSYTTSFVGPKYISLLGS